MKKKLTVNTLAIGNLKHRRKQYAIMLLGIMLAMIFSSGVIFFLFSMRDSQQEKNDLDYGRQSGILTVAEGGTEEFFEGGKAAGAYDNFGYAHLLGFAYTDDKRQSLGTAVAWLDDKAESLAYHTLLEGRMPEKDGEIAIEKTQLVKLGLEAKAGDAITLKMKVRNGDGYLEQPVEKTYQLVGILHDKCLNIQRMYGSIDNHENEVLACALVAQGCAVEPGGRELLEIYYQKPLGTFASEQQWDEWYTTFWHYFGEREWTNIDVGGWKATLGSGMDLSENASFLFFLAAVLMLASCIAIINAFNTNLKERKRQIGLLRAVGATKRQIIQIFGREALLISLLCAPLSMAVAYGAVWAASGLFGEAFVLSKSLYVLPICFVFDVAVVMLSAMLPLLSAAKITPMQAIRNIHLNRKMKTKRIKTQTDFNVPKLLAKRYGIFYKGSSVAVSILLIVTIALSCFGFSWIYSTKDELHAFPSDYTFEGMEEYSFSDCSFKSYEGKGITASERAEIEALPYVSRTTGYKQCPINWLIDSYDNDYYKCVGYTEMEVFDDVQEEADTLDADGLRRNMQQPGAYHQQHCQTFGYSGNYLGTHLVSADSAILSKLKDYVTDGEINEAALAAGTQIILVAPQKAVFRAAQQKYGGSYGCYTDEEIERAYHKEPYEKDFAVLFEGECPYKAGDTVTLSDITYASVEEEEEHPERFQRQDKTVTIGAIVSRNGVTNDEAISLPVYDEFYAVTLNSAMAQFHDGLNYSDFSIDCDEEITEEINQELMESFQKYADIHDAYIRSNYDWVQTQQKDMQNALLMLLALIIISFTVCGSIINNSLTANIRENKREIGTLRAVGASQRELVSSYIRQLTASFAVGYGGGFGAYVLGQLGLMVYHKITNVQSTYTFFPWITLALCVLLFGVCALNLRLKIRKEMKNSIVENIREL